MLNSRPAPFGPLITAAMMLTTTPLVAPAQQDGSRVTQIIIDKDGNISQPNRNQRRTRPRHRDWSLDFETVKQHFVIVKTALGAGSGFIVKMGDKFYVVTNQHVIAGASKLSFSTLDGQTLKPVSVEVCAHQDLARFLLKDFSDGLGLAQTVNIREHIVIYGNSGGAGVVTEIYGDVSGVGPGAVELNAQFVRGNSGSPILNNEGRVVGVATYATLKPASFSDWVSAGTRFNQIRRFGLRLGEGLIWHPVRWNEYVKQSTLLMKSEAFLDQALGLAGIWSQKPVEPIASMGQLSPSLELWVKNHNDKVAGKFAKLSQKVSVRENRLRVMNIQMSKAIRNSSVAMNDQLKNAAKPLTRPNRRWLTPYFSDKAKLLADTMLQVGMAIESVGGALSDRPVFRFSVPSGGNNDRFR